MELNDLTFSSATVDDLDIPIVSDIRDTISSISGYIEDTPGNSYIIDKSRDLIYVTTDCIFELPPSTKPVTDVPIITENVQLQPHPVKEIAVSETRTEPVFKKKRVSRYICVCGQQFNEAGSVSKHALMCAASQLYRESLARKKLEVNSSKQENYVEVQTIPHDVCERTMITYPENDLTCSYCFTNFPSHADLTLHKKAGKGKPSHCADCGQSLECLMGVEYHRRVGCIGIQRARNMKVDIRNDIETLLQSDSEASVSCSSQNSTNTSNEASSDESPMNNVSKKQNIVIETCHWDDFEPTKLQQACDKLPKKATKRRPYRCNICSKLYATLTALEDHIRSHTGVKPFQCSECSKSFTSAQYLRNHAVVHTTERPYECLQCSKRFKTLKTCREHETLHSGHSRCLCQHCGKGFRSGALLDEHLRRFHVHQKPFKCGACGKAFVSKRLMIKHAKYAHENDIF